MRIGSVLLAAVVALGVVPTIPHEHEDHSRCEDGQPLTHVEGCDFHSTGDGCDLCSPSTNALDACVSAFLVADPASCPMAVPAGSSLSGDGFLSQSPTRGPPARAT